jgi:hypothetical protein
MKEREGLFLEISYLQEIGDRDFFLQPLAGVLPSTAAHLGYLLNNGIPLLVTRENQPWGTTFYVEIDLNIPQNYCENWVKGKCVKSGITAKPVSTTSAIFIPRGFQQDKPISLIIYLHGHKTSKPGKEASIQEYLNYTKFDYFRLREKVAEAGRNVVFVAPTLGPKSAAGSLVKKGGFDTYVTAVLKAIEYYTLRSVSKKGLTPCSLVIAAHSGGGKPMGEIVTLPDKYAGQIRECWGFDSLYQGYNIWNKWSDGNSDRIYYNYYDDENKKNSEYSPVKQSAKLSAFNKRRSIDLRPKGISHWGVITKFLAERIKGLPDCDPVAGTPDREFETGWTSGWLPTHATKPAPQPNPSGIGLFFRPTSPTSTYYGQFDLQIKDKDGSNKQRYGGAEQGIVGNPAHVKQLQEDLLELGFGYKSKPDGVFDFDTECAVREFQIYAKMPNVAIGQTGKGMLLNPVDRYAAIRNNYPYQGEVNGVVNQETRNRIEFWKKNNWRCPVVIQAWEFDTKLQQKKRVFKSFYNIWKFKEVKKSSVRMFVRDFSGYYKAPPCVVPPGKNIDDYMMLGKYSPYEVNNKIYGGPESNRRSKTIWPETEITPDDWFGKSFSLLSPAEQSTFKVIRSVAEVECEGHMDSINGYDRAFISLGPYHLVLDIYSEPQTEPKKKPGATYGGELPAYISFLKEVAAATHEKAFGFFGMTINNEWHGNGQAFFMSGGQRKYGMGRVGFKRGSNPIFIKGYDEGINIGNYFRSWHWFYRFVMAARVLPEFRRKMWDFSRLRIRNLLSLEVKDLGFKNGQGKPVNPALSEILTSELAVALALRMHVKLPAKMAEVNSDKNTLRRILTKALTSMKNAGIVSSDITQWGDRNQSILIDTFFNEMAHEISLQWVRDFNLQQGGVLSSAAGSFQFHSAGLPAPPIY